MISTMLAMTLAATAAQADPVNDARRAYSECMRNFMRTSLQQRMEPTAFETALEGQCTDRAVSYREAMIRRDQRTGGGRARAEEDANTTIQYTKENTLEYYRDYYENEQVPD